MTNMPPSQELVPLDYDRYAYNSIHGFQLEAHDDVLSPYQAERINRNFDIQLYFGSHGDAKGSPEDDVIENEYQAAESVIDGMKPGDTLFIEDYGFEYAVIEPIVQNYDTMFSPHSRYKGLLELMATAGSGVDIKAETDAQRQAHQDWLDGLRQKQAISAWSYAGELARRKGIRVVSADLDAFEAHKADQLGFYDQKKNMDAGIDEDGKSLNGRIDAWRERAARNIVKDWALGHMPTREPSTDEDKPKLVMLYGLLHYDGIKQVFDDAGLECTAQALDVRERVLILARKLMSTQVSIVGKYLGDKFGAAIKNSHDRELKLRKPSINHSGKKFGSGAAFASVSSVGNKNRLSRSNKLAGKPGIEVTDEAESAAETTENVVDDTDREARK